MTDYTLTGSAAEMRAKAAQERANLLARNVGEFREAEAKIRAEEPDLADKAKAAGLLFGASMDKAQNSMTEHLDHVLQCSFCAQHGIEMMRVAQERAKLERKAKKWKRRAKKAEALTYSKANLDGGFAERAKELGYALSDPHDGVNVHADGSMTNARTGKPVGPLNDMYDFVDAVKGHEVAATTTLRNGTWRCTCGVSGDRVYSFEFHLRDSQRAQKAREAQ